jgi:predicted nucleotidyltransferase
MEGRKKTLTRENVLYILSQHKSSFVKRFGITRLGAFGSVMRSDSFVYNDVDIVIEMQKPDLFFMVHIKEELEAALSCPVDVIHYRERMNGFLKKRINKEAVYV